MNSLKTALITMGCFCLLAMAYNLQMNFDYQSRIMGVMNGLQRGLDKVGRSGLTHRVAQTIYSVVKNVEQEVEANMQAINVPSFMPIPLANVGSAGDQSAPLLEKGVLGGVGANENAGEALGTRGNGKPFEEGEGATGGIFSGLLPGKLSLHGTTPVVDGVWELEGQTGVYREAAVSMKLPPEVDSDAWIRERLQQRSFARMSMADSPWKGMVSNYSKRLLDASSPQGTLLGYCNPMSRSCDCLDYHAGRPYCSEVAHRQKPVLNVASAMHEQRFNFDCPSLRCEYSNPGNYTSEDEAFITMVGYFHMKVLVKFPPKKNNETKNLLISMEAAGRYDDLNNSAWMTKNKVDVHATHTPNGVSKDTEWLPLSFAELPAGYYRRQGLSFQERSNMTSFFTSNCRGGKALARWNLLQEMTLHMQLVSYVSSQCRWWNSTLGNVQRDWPQCFIKDLPTKGKTHLSGYKRYAEKECILSKSRLTVIVENTREKGYVSEKIFQAFSAGAVPIYVGAPDIKELLPDPDAAIHLDDFASVKDLMHYAVKVNHNEELWLKHTAWKRKPFPPHFLKWLRIGNSPCTICEHFASKAKPAPQLTPTLAIRSGCLESLFSKAKDGRHLPVMQALSPSGVDAIFVVQDANTSPEASAWRQRMLDVWNASVLPITEFAPGSLLPSDLECVSGSAGRGAKVLSCPGENKAAIAQHLFVAYVMVRHALPISLVLRSSAEAAEWQGGVTWQRFLHGLPPDFEVANVGQACGKGGAEVCSGGYLMSQQGARKVLGGLEAKVLPGGSEQGMKLPGRYCGG